MLSKKTYTVKEATKKLEYYCAYQERCHQEVRQKLIGMYMIPEAIDVIVVHLLEHNFLNEERFAKAYVSGKFKFKGWGKRRLKMELERREISLFNINEALAEVSNEEYITFFNSLAEKKIDSIKESSVYKKRKKFIDYFLYRGWESHIVYNKANELISQS